MDKQKKPRSRIKKIVGDGKDFEKKGEALGSASVNQVGNYVEGKEQQSQQISQRPQYVHRPSMNSQIPFEQIPPQQTQNPFRQGKQEQQTFNPFVGNQKPQQSQIPYRQQQQPTVTGAQKQYKYGVKQNGNGTQRVSGTGTGSSGKLLLVVIALVVLLGGGGLSSLFGGENSPVSYQTEQSMTSSTSQQSGDELGISNLLNSFLTSSGSSSYDLSTIWGGINGSVSSSDSIGSLVSSSGSIESQLTQPLNSLQNLHSFPSSTSDNGSTYLNENISDKAREKYTVLRGNNKDTVTILVYMCGTDLESQQGMATADLKEMVNATVSNKVNLIIYTGGCNRWRNNVISPDVNQIYKISDGKLECLDKNAGSGSMVNEETLLSFLQFGKKNFKADRMCLIFWDHGGGSVSGYGYDEKIGHNQSMTLAGINSALNKADIKFDFIGFDACLMATVENGLMLSQYADYLIASEETEPGVGWYYTNWLTQLSKNTSMPTVHIGKLIADDFVAVCERQCRGQATTLSVVDLAELQATIPNELKEFSIETNQLIQNKEYKKISSARSKTREFAQQSKIDQIDLVDFANRIGSSESKELATALKGAVKYNRTGGGITCAYGLSIYFPYKRAGKVNQMVSTYQKIGMDEEYTRCIQEFASLEIAGQVCAGTPVSSVEGQNASPGLLGSLLGQGGGYTSSYSTGGLEELLGGIYNSGNVGGATGSILDLFMGRNTTVEDAAQYIMDNHFDASHLVWQEGRIELSQNDWDNTVSLVKNVFADDGSGYIDLGCDAQYMIEGNTLVDDFDGTWLSMDGNVMPYYTLGTIEYDNDEFVIYGYAPALLNGTRVNIIIEFINGEEGYIAGAQYVYADGEGGTQAKMMIDIGKGDRIQFVCDYYDYDGNFRDSYKVGDEFSLGSSYEIGDAKFNKSFRVTYCFTDIYQQNYWTPAVVY